MTQNSYSPYDHLMQIRAKDGTMKDYLPANWRLYELRLRFPQVTLESEIVHMDEEHNLVIVKAWIFDGKTYAESEHRASAYKQGQLSSLDKVETGAKSRAARDFGIGTEYALDMEDEDEQVDTSGALAAIKEELKTLGLVRNPGQWAAWKKQAIGRDLSDSKLTPGHIGKLTAAIAQHKNSQAA